MTLLLPKILSRMKLGCRYRGSIEIYNEISENNDTDILPAWSRIVGTPRVEGYNDTIGDCVETAGFNAVQTMAAREGKLTPIPNHLVPGVYSAVTGYNPNIPATDQGTDPEVFFTWWRQNAIFGCKLSNLIRLNPRNENAIRDSIIRNGGVFLCVELATAQQNEIIWTASGTPGSWGGHAVWCDSFEAELTFATSWGQVKPIDRSYFQHGFVAAAYGLELNFNVTA